MPLSITVLQRRPDPDDPAVQQVTAEINGVRVMFDGAPGSAQSARELAAWLRRVHTEAELAALAVMQQEADAEAAPPEYFVVRPADVGSPVLQAALRILVERLNTLEAAANISPTTLDHILDACLVHVQGPSPQPMGSTAAPTEAGKP